MERYGVQLLYRGSRRSFEKAQGAEAPPHLQVIGFDVSPKDERPSPASNLLPVIKSAASSPRSSALQQLLLHQSPAHSPSPSSNQSLPPRLPPSSSNQSLPPPLPPPSAANSASNLHLPCGLLLPPAANQKSTSAGLLQPSAIPKSTTGEPVQPAANPNQLKSLLQSVHANSHVPANQSSPTNFLSSVGQSTPSSGLAVNMQMISQHNSNRSEALRIKENSKAFSQIKRTCDDELNDAEAHEISAQQVINELPYIVAKSQKSSWLHDISIEHPSPGKSRWTPGVQQIVELSFASEKSRKSSCRSEEKSKKSSLFMFAASSPATKFHRHHHYHGGEHYNTSGNLDFLSSCHLCRRLLGQGQDVFMYSGDKAFCSMECRYEQIVIDERKERCAPPNIRSGASPVYQHSSANATTTHHPIIINKPHFINTTAAA